MDAVGHTPARGAVPVERRPVRADLSSVALAGLRGGIDLVDDGLVALLAARRRLVGLVALAKARAGRAARDPARERRVHDRARRLATRLGVPAASARDLLAVAISDARNQQAEALDVHQGAIAPAFGTIARMDRTVPMPIPASRLLRLLPPPARFAPLLRLLPHRAARPVLEKAMAHALSAPLREGELDFMRGRRLGIQATDLDFGFVVELRDGRLRVVDAPAEASVRGSATDLLLLASRLEDADTLFFQRRLTLTGDTELGLTARNLLDRLPWESVPLGLRIVLNRGARFARAARTAHRGD